MYSETTNCRCCLNPSTNFVNLHSMASITGVEDRTYNEIIQELTKSNIGGEDTGNEFKIPQKICMKCVKQLKQVYIFILQIRNVYNHYLKLSKTENIEDTKCLKDIGNLDETLIEIPNNRPNEYEDTIPLFEGVKIEPLKGLELSNDKDMEEEHKLEFDIDNENEAVFSNDIVRDSLDERDINSEDEPSTNDYNIMSFESLARRCEECHKVYKDERSLNIHKRFTHMPEEEKIPCPCAGCDYKTSRSSALKVHLGLIHGTDKVEEYFRTITATDKKFPCTLCGRGYQRREDLRKHFRKKHKNPNPPSKSKIKEKPSKSKDEHCFLCPSCGQSYTTKKALDGHLLSHDNNRPYACDICDKAFKRMKDLNAHRVIHSDAKPFQCSNCEKSFKRADKLKIHMRVHSEIRPYQCEHCEKTFKYPSVLRTHMHIHTGQTPFACKTCGEAFSLRTSLNNHCLKNEHEK
ncbi:uncharacterized protein LOC142241242 [Haematobia irritans]|uniref:uncharacterized protein LOC142241242 n=1 Tax=Haematobia irritans TaxID=7368 RepID=UPI003F4FAEBC